MDATAYFEQGNLALSRDNLGLAAQLYIKALSLDGNCIEALYNLGVIHHRTGDIEQAVRLYEQALAIKPDFVQALFNLGHALSDLNRIEPSMAAYQKVLELEPDTVSALYNLAGINQSMGQTATALDLYRKVLEQDPDHVQSLNNMGVLYRDDDRLEQARACFEKVLNREPGFVQALYNLGIVYQKEGDYEQGLAYYQKALALNPDYMPARWLHALSLPMFYDNAAQIDAARRRFSDNLDTLVREIPLRTPEQKHNALEGIGSTTHFYLQYQGRNDIDLQKRYGRFVCGVMAANFPDLSETIPMPAVETDAKIRIGYVSSLMYSHTIGIFLLGWLENSSRDRFEISCYHVGARTDDLTRRIMRASNHFHHLPGNVEAAARRIKSDRLHLLVHTDVGMNPATLQLAALRLAPVQCKGWGHPVTTGLPTMDYYLSSDLMEPEEARSHYSETLVRLPDLALCYKPP